MCRCRRPRRRPSTRDPELLEALLTGGDDYEIVAAVPEGNTSGFEAEAKSKGVTVTRIGRIEGTTGTRLLGEGGRDHEARAQGIRTLLGCWRPVRGEFPGGHAPPLLPACIFGIFRPRLAPSLLGAVGSSEHASVSPFEALFLLTSLTERIEADI